MLRTLVSPKRLHVACFDFNDEELVPDPARVRRVPDAVVYQSMHDGMRRARNGIEPNCGASHGGALPRLATTARSNPVGSVCGAAEALPGHASRVSTAG
jgi:hypothetical protein